MLILRLLLNILIYQFFKNRPAFLPQNFFKGLASPCLSEIILKNFLCFSVGFQYFIVFNFFLEFSKIKIFYKWLRSLCPAQKAVLYRQRLFLKVMQHSFSQIFLEVTAQTMFGGFGRPRLHSIRPPIFPGIVNKEK